MVVEVTIIIQAVNRVINYGPFPELNDCIYMSGTVVV